MIQRYNRLTGVFRPGLSRMLLLAVFMMSFPVQAAVHVRGTRILEPTASGGTQLIGEIVRIPGGAAEVISVPAGTRLLMHFYRYDTRMNVVAQKEYSLDALSFYGPSLAWDGERFAVVASTLTRTTFLIIDPEGNIISGPMELPDIPHEGRTAAFKVIWTGTHYAVFGLWLEKEFPFQDIVYGNFYTHLHYWLLDRDGNRILHKELAMLAPMSYPGIEGAEKTYYDVVWTGRSIFLTYYSESANGPPLSAYYKIFDIEGNLVADERSLWATQTTQGARLAWNGRTIAATGVKSITVPNPNAGNYMYLRCFHPDGTPIGNEVEYGQKLGFGPTVFAAEDCFVTAYVILYDPNTQGYALMFTEFDADGNRLSNSYPAQTLDGTVLLGRMTLGFDLQFTSGTDLIYGMAQAADAYLITSQPLSFSLRYRPPTGPRLRLARPDDQWLLQWPDDAPDYQLQAAPHPGGAWAPVAGNPVEADGYHRLALPVDGTRFYRLAR